MTAPIGERGRLGAALRELDELAAARKPAKSCRVPSPVDPDARPGDVSVVEDLRKPGPPRSPIRMGDGVVKCPHGTLDRPSCKRRSCSVCGPRWARDWRRVLAVNLEHAGVDVTTIAITAPGRDRLPWACTRNHKHEGKHGCKVEERALREWCETLGWRWQKLRQAARQRVKRELGAVPPEIMCRVWEPQKRGAPHVHLVVRFGSKYEQALAWSYLRHLRELAPLYDFGEVQRRRGGGPDLQPITGQDAARYLASYLTGRSAKKHSIRENISDPRLPRSLLWLTPRLTRQTLVTMRTLRRARHLWAASYRKCDVPRWTGLEEAVAVTVVFRTIYPKRAGPTRDADGALMWARTVGAYVDAHTPALEWDGEALTRPDDWDLKLTRMAFEATRDPEWKREAVA